MASLHVCYFQVFHISVMMQLSRLLPPRSSWRWAGSLPGSEGAEVWRWRARSQRTGSHRRWRSGRFLHAKICISSVLHFQLDTQKQQQHSFGCTSYLEGKRELHGLQCWGVPSVLQPLARLACAAADRKLCSPLCPEEQRRRMSYLCLTLKYSVLKMKISLW